MSDERAAAELTEAEEMRAWNRDLVAARNLLSKESREANAEIMRLRADLARALPIVEAAGALESFIDKHPIEAERYFTFESKLETLIDVLARAVRAVRELDAGKGTG